MANATWSSVLYHVYVLSSNIHVLDCYIFSSLIYPCVYE